MPVPDRTSEDQISPADYTDIEVKGDGLYVFISFDLVHSTRFKLQNPGKWQDIFGNFFICTAGQVTQKIKQTQIWKHVGDEILFFCKTNDKENIANIPSHVHKIQANVIQELKEQALPAAEPLLVKSTIWTAFCDSYPRVKGSRDSRQPPAGNDNIRLYHELHAQTSIIDFLGPDIDRGFRLSKHATRARVLVSAEFAYLFHKANLHSAPNSGLRIVDYAPLKDILDGRPYPLVWFDTNWDNINSTFFYDEKMQNKAIENIIHGKTEPIEGIVKIIKDLHEDQRLDAVLAALTSD